MNVLSPCESCTTVLSCDAVPFNPKVLGNYIEVRKDSQDWDLDLVLKYNEGSITVALSAVYVFINAFASTPVDKTSITVNHLIIYLYHNRKILYGATNKMYVNQITLIHCGKSYKFAPHSSRECPYSSSYDQKILDLPNIREFTSFHLLIQENTHSGFNVYQYFNAENFLKVCLSDKSSRLRKWMHKIKANGQDKYRTDAKEREAIRSARKLFFFDSIMGI